MSRHWSVIGEAGVLRGMQFMVWVHRYVGRVGFNFALFFVMAYFFLRRGEARRASRDYLQRVRRRYPDALDERAVWWLSFRQFFAFGESILDKYLAWAQTPEGIAMTPDEEKLLFDFVETGKGCLLIGSHFGNLEYSRGIAHRHPDVRINVLIYDQHAKNFAALLEQSDPDSRLNLIQVTDIDFQLALTLKEKVQRGEWVVIAGDRVPIGESGRVCTPVFFGEEARFPIGPYVLASLLQCRVFLLHCFQVDGEYHLGIESFADRIAPERSVRYESYEAYAQQFATALERQVVKAPLQWFNFYDFWGNDAEG